MAANQLFLSFILNKHRIDKQGECPISIRITINGERQTIQTGVNANPKLWDSTKGRLKGQSPLIASQNNLLNALKGKIITVYTEQLNSGMPLSATVIKNKINGVSDRMTSLMEVVLLHNAYVLKKVGIEVCGATHTKYETLRKKLEAFILKEYKRKDIFLKELNQRFVIRGC